MLLQQHLACVCRAKINNWAPRRRPRALIVCSLTVTRCDAARARATLFYALRTQNYTRVRMRARTTHTHKHCAIEQTQRVAPRSRRRRPIQRFCGGALQLTTYLRAAAAAA